MYIIISAGGVLLKWRKFLGSVKIAGLHREVQTEMRTDRAKSNTEHEFSMFSVTACMFPCSTLTLDEVLGEYVPLLRALLVWIFSYRANVEPLMTTLQTCAVLRHENSLSSSSW